MKVCTLCENREANKTGSHLIPHFLLKMVENIDNSGKRDRGLGFRLTQEDVTVHFERAVPSEKIEEVVGVLTDEELKAIRSPSIKDHIYCSDCETYFGRLENKYSQSLVVSGIGKYYSNSDSLTSLLFWLSIFWRASSDGNSGYKLTKAEEELCRSILNHYSTKDDVHAIDPFPSIDEIGYKIIRGPGFSDKKTGFINFDSKEIRPYCLMLGEYAIFLYFKIGDVILKPKIFYGLENLLDNAPLNDFKSGEIIFGCDESVFDKANELLANDYAKVRIEGIITQTLEVAADRYGEGILIPEWVIKSIITEVISRQDKLGLKYGNNEILETINLVLSLFRE